MVSVVWAWCRHCMNRQDHQYVPGKGWVCKSCKQITLRELSAKKEKNDEPSTDDLH